MLFLLCHVTKVDRVKFVMLCGFAGNTTCKTKPLPTLLYSIFIYKLNKVFIVHQKQQMGPKNVNKSG